MSATATLPSFETYGNYSSSNYGAHCLRFQVGTLSVWYSYKTPIAFYHPSVGKVIRENEWGPTTGKHLNAVDPDKKKRIPGIHFEATLRQLLETLNV